MLKLNFFIYIRKNLIVIYENRKDKIIEIIFNLIKYKSLIIIKFLKPKNETAPKIGIDSKKEILAASILLKFSNLAAVIAMPDLLTPESKLKFERIL